MKKLLITAEQVINLRNNMIISEALEDEISDVKDTALPNAVQEPGNPPPDAAEKKDSLTYGMVTDTLVKYLDTYGLPQKIAADIHKEHPTIDIAGAEDFIKQFFTAVNEMAKDPKANATFERYLHTAGVTISPALMRTGVNE